MMMMMMVMTTMMMMMMIVRNDIGSQCEWMKEVGGYRVGNCRK